jgi:hypothetical protein
MQSNALVLLHTYFLFSSFILYRPTSRYLFSYTSPFRLLYSSYFIFSKSFHSHISLRSFTPSLLDNLLICNFCSLYSYIFLTLLRCCVSHMQFSSRSPSCVKFLPSNIYQIIVLLRYSKNRCMSVRIAQRWGKLRKAEITHLRTRCAFIMFHHNDIPNITINFNSIYTLKKAHTCIRFSFSYNRKPVSFKCSLLK